MFWQRTRSVRETLLTASDSDSTHYAVITYSDGGLGITRDGRPLPAFYWPPSRMDECVATFMHLSGLSQTAWPSFTN